MKNLNNRFSVAPSRMDMKTSTFDMPYRHLSTGNFGDIIPFYAQEVLPGDSFSLTTSLFSRMSTPLYPVMDDAWIDYFYFFVPNRLVWTHWAEFLGENKLSAWVQDVDYIIPHAKVVPEVGSVYDHLGVPTYSADNAVAKSLGGRPSLDIGFLLPRMYHLIYNEWFRNENTTDPIIVNTGDDVSAEEVARFQTLCKAAKPFDAFTAALPSPQKGDAVDIPLVGNAIVKTSADNLIEPTSDYNNADFSNAMRLWMNDANPGSGYFMRICGDENDTSYVGQVDACGTISNQSNVKYVGGPLNLYADMSTVSATTINQLRQAFQMQRLLELQARAGSRYTEIIKASFGVTSPDARLQRSEYLGGSKVRIQMQQVTQTSGTTDESPLGKVGAYSKTVSLNHDFSKAFTEHGYIIGVAVARHALTYSQGLAKMWTRRGRYDFYWPTFANIGEQPIYRRELFATGDDDSDNTVFGYQEAWYEYRYKPNELSGMFRPTIEGNLDEWHYGEYYESAPLLSEGWMNASAVNVDRTLAVTSALHHQLLFDFNVDCKASRVMPLYSIPGLIDHF